MTLPIIDIKGENCFDFYFVGTFNRKYILECMTIEIIVITVEEHYGRFILELYEICLIYELWPKKLT